MSESIMTEKIYKPFIYRTNKLNNKNDQFVLAIETYKKILIP